MSFLSWVTFSPASGLLWAGQSTTVMLEIGGGESGLSTGSSSDTASFTSTAIGDGNTRRSVSLAVNPLGPASLTDLMIHYEHEPGILCDGGSAKFTATASWDNGTTAVVDATWSVSPTTYASIDASTGVLTTNMVNGVSQDVTVQASYTSDNVTRTATRTVSITDCHVDGPMWSCAAVGHARKTNHMDLAGSYVILFLILGLLKFKGSSPSRPAPRKRAINGKRMQNE